MPASVPKTIWITGASTGIGRELALSFARDGATVAVSARSAQKLKDLADVSKNIRAYPVDVTDGAAVAATAALIWRDLGGIDLAVLNAGVWHPMTAESYDLANAMDSMNVNYLGVINCLQPVMREMIERGSGHIALVSSVAGYRGLPKSAAYGPTKAALINLAESLYPELRAKGVRMTLICPGFVATPMTDVNTFPMPFIVSTRVAISYIRHGLERDAFEIVFPWRMAVTMKSLRLLPQRMFFWLTRPK